MPQFIDIEDKLFGQFTFVQSVYLVGGASMAYVIWQLIPGFLSILKIPVAGLILALALALAFYPKDKYGKPFIGLMEAAFQFYFVRTKLYTWKRIPKKKVSQKKGEQKRSILSVTLPNISESNLKSLSWGLDVNQEVS
ncbi:MAG: PrgI family protein [Candidatus Pacebacteria bacterium]|nr:PrgI family protein [Candidatus Paceibacterota bacterium]